MSQRHKNNKPHSEHEDKGVELQEGKPHANTAKHVLNEAKHVEINEKQLAKEEVHQQASHIPMPLPPTMP